MITVGFKHSGSVKLSVAYDIPACSGIWQTDVGNSPFEYTCDSDNSKTIVGPYITPSSCLEAKTMDSKKVICQKCGYSYVFEADGSYKVFSSKEEQGQTQNAVRLANFHYQYDSDNKMSMCVPLLKDSSNSMERYCPGLDFQSQLAQGDIPRISVCTKTDTDSRSNSFVLFGDIELCDKWQSEQVSIKDRFTLGCVKCRSGELTSHPSNKNFQYCVASE